MQLDRASIEHAEILLNMSLNTVSEIIMTSATPHNACTVTINSLKTHLQ